jgi:basic amino acid/polyamine antiporter, APA family
MEKHEQSLKRDLGLFTGILLVAGLLIGSGVFQKIAPMSRTNIGEVGILLAWATAGLISLIGAFTIGGLTSLSETSGGIYDYLRISFGKFFSFIYGWSDFTIVGTGVNAALASFFSETVNFIFPLPNPLQSWEHISIANYIFPFENSGIKILGLGTLILLTIVNFFGTRESGLINNVLTSAKILGILILIIFGLTYSAPVTSVNIETINYVSSPKGWNFLSSFLTALLAALWAFDGWTYATNIGGEIKNPKRNLPIALTSGILITTAVYLFLNYVFMHIIPLEKFGSLPDTSIGALAIAEVLLGRYGKVLLSILVIICVFGALNSSILSLPRRYYQMAQEGYFFSNAKRIHPKYKTPVVALLYSMVWSCILLVSYKFDQLTNMVVFSSFIFYGLLCIALFRMKRNGTIKEKVFGYPTAPVLFLIISFVLTVHFLWSDPKDSAIGLILILSSIPFYLFFRNRNNSRRITQNIE